MLLMTFSSVEHSNCISTTHHLEVLLHYVKITPPCHEQRQLSPSTRECGNDMRGPDPKLAGLTNLEI
jgi:hypothetical protein